MRLPMLTHRRLLGAIAGAVLLAGCALDMRRLPSAQLSTAGALALVHLYQRTVSPVMPRLGVRCRFTPTCSRYAEAVLRARGFPGGAWLTLKRVARCGPWTAEGTIDPPPMR
jgi:uncharacterized protein